MPSKREAVDFVRFADILGALGTEPRLRIMQLLLTAHPTGLVVSQIQEELGIPAEGRDAVYAAHMACKARRARPCRCDGF